MGEEAGITRIWLSHASNDPSELTINWESSDPSKAIVEFGETKELGQRTGNGETALRHHVTVPFASGKGRLFYRVGEGALVSSVWSVQRYPEDELRVAIIGDWSGGKALNPDGLPHDAPHLLVTAGDNVPRLWNQKAEGTKAFAALIDSAPELFRSTPFLPVLGNHDRELTLRGPTPPDHPVYDIEATAYREFFALPDEEWKWQFTFPHFSLRLVALDLNHLSDFGTTWQTCHAWQKDSEQFQWYSGVMGEAREDFVVTVMNEKRTALEAAGKGLWAEQYLKGSALVTGFGHFAERSELAGRFPYFNTSVIGTGSLYLDPHSKFHASEDSYLLLTLKSDKRVMRAELKSLNGVVLEKIEIPSRALVNP